MAEILTSNQNYYDIANTIRQMKKVNTTYKPREMASALKDIYSNEIEGTLPLSFEANGNNLLNYRIDGASGGVGDLITDTSDEKFGKYKIPVVITGKNIFNENSELNTDGTLNLDSGLYPFSVGNNRRTFFFNVKPNTTYTFSCSSIGDRFAVCEYNSIINPSNYSTENKLSADRNIYSQANGILSYSFTTSSTAKMVGIYYSLNTIPTNIQIEIGNKTTYEPYSEIVTNIYLDNPIGVNESVSLSDTNVSIPTNYGMNIMSINTTIQPSNVYVQVFKDIQGLVDKSLLRKSIDKFGSNLSENDSSKSYCDALDDIYNKLPKITQSGAGFTLENVQNGQVDDFKMIGVDLEQSETPTPDNPQEIKVVEGRQVITDKGKNLFDINSGINTNNLIDAGITSVFNADGTITVNGEKTANYKYIRYSITLPAGTYYFCGCPSGGSNSSYSSLVQLTQDTSSQIFDTGNGATFTLIEQTTIQYFPVRVGDASLTFNNTIFKPMISTTPITYDDYEPYYEPVSYNIDLQSENLSNGINQNYWINTGATSCGISGSNSGLAIDVRNLDVVEISTSETQQRYRVACVSSLPQSGATVDCYRGVNKDDTSSSITINTAGYNYLIVNATDLTKLNVYYKYELAKMPDTTYKNRIYKNNGNWYYEKNIEKVVLDGSEDWYRVDNSSYSESIIRYRCDDFTDILSTGFGAFILSSNFKGFPLGHRTENGIARQLDSSGLNIFIDKSIINDSLTNFKNWLSTNNVEVWYSLDNPITTQITNTTLINQLEAISVHTGTNIITISNSNNIIPEIEITRLKELEKLL